jgi:hypothetical protein
VSAIVHRPLVAGLVLATLAFAASAEPIYQCESAKNSRFQNAPCPSGTKQTVVTAPALWQEIAVGDPKTGTYTPEAGKLRQMVFETITVLATYPVCAQSDAGYAKAHGASLEAWKKKNGAFIERVKGDSKLRGYLDNGMELEKKRATDPAERTKQAGECTNDIPAILKN